MSLDVNWMHCTSLIVQETNVAENPKVVTTQSLAIGMPVSKSWAFQNRWKHTSKKNESRLQYGSLTKAWLYETGVAEKHLSL